MRITQTRKRSGPIYRQVRGRIKSYVVERADRVLNLDAMQFRLPPTRRVYIIDERGVHIRSRVKSRSRVVTVYVVAVALFALYRRARRKR